MKNYTWMFTAALFVRAKKCKQMSFNGWMVKQMVVHMYYELLFAWAFEWATIWVKTQISGDYVLNDFIYIAFLKWQIIEMENRLVVVRG